MSGAFLLQVCVSVCLMFFKADSLVVFSPRLPIANIFQTVCESDTFKAPALIEIKNITRIRCFFYNVTVYL